MPKKYRTILHKTPFEHVEYTLTRNQKQFNRVLGRKNEQFLSLGFDAQVDYFEHPNGGYYAIVQLGDTAGKTLAVVHSLLLHEAVHIWQRAVLVMGEKEPSKEFEAYSIQRIALDLFDLYEKSEAK